MSTRIKDYGVGALARAAKVSIRTLHHYDAIGLLKPMHVGENGYRTYGEAELLRLQEILFYREVGLSLADIAKVLDGPDDRITRLTRHRARLVQERQRLDGTLLTLDATLDALKGEKTMRIEDLYTPFTPEKQAGYEAWLSETYGEGMAEAITTSKTHLSRDPDGMEAIMNLLRDIEAALVEAYKAEKADVDDLLAQHRDWVSQMWGYSCGPKAYAGLAELYLSHPDFVERYEALAPKFSQWLTSKMKDWAGRTE